MKKIFLLFLFFSSAFCAQPKQLACAAVKACLQIELSRCSHEDLEPVEKIKYDQKFCAPFLNLTRRGLDPSSPIAFEVFSHLGKPFRVIYENKGTLPVKPDMMHFLFDHLPFTAQLVNAYQKTEYFIAYDSPDHLKFHGSSGGSLFGKFNWILQDSAKHHPGFHNVFFGFGGAKVLKWELRGTAIAILDMEPIQGSNQIKYRFRTFVFPANTVLHSIMQMQAFKGVVNDKINEIIKNIERASTQFAKGNRKPIEKYPSLKREPYQSKLLLFDSIVNGTPWNFGDVFRIKEMNP